MGWRAAFRIPAPDEKVEGWHVSPLVDLSAYALSWAWVLVPLLLLGPAREDYLLIYLLLIALNDLHRHIALPYVYCDAQVRARYPARFWLLPAVLLAACVVSPILDHSELVLSTAQVCAIAAQVVVLVQILRRDGGPEALATRRLLPALGLMLGGALLASLAGQALGLGVAGAWWWITAALFCSTWIDWQRLRATATAGSDTSAAPPTKEQGIAAVGGPRFAASLIILALMGLALLAGPWIHAHQPEGGLPVTYLLAFVGAVAALWNFWHVYMQKYGILRMYNAKSQALAGRKPTPGPLDKALLLSWLPLYFAYLGPLYREVAIDYFSDAATVLPPFLDLLEQAMPVTIPVTVAGVVMVHVLWLKAEWHANELKSAPRLWMVGGTTALALCFFVFDPIKVYMGFAFSHALEYCVFVWAFQRKRYQGPLSHAPTLGRWLRRPALFYLGMAVIFGGVIMLGKYWGRDIMVGAERPELFGYRVAYLLGFWGVYQSLMHFYFDGFLWKMRLPSVRKNL